jgi:hypothetical protein
MAGFEYGMWARIVKFDAGLTEPQASGWVNTTIGMGSGSTWSDVGIGIAFYNNGDGVGMGDMRGRLTGMFPTVGGTMKAAGAAFNDDNANRVPVDGTSAVLVQFYGLLKFDGGDGEFSADGPWESVTGYMLDNEEATGSLDVFTMTGYTRRLSALLGSDDHAIVAFGQLANDDESDLQFYQSGFKTLELIPEDTISGNPRFWPDLRWQWFSGDRRGYHIRKGDGSSFEDIDFDMMNPNAGGVVEDLHWAHWNDTDSFWRDSLTAPQYHPNVMVASEGGPQIADWLRGLLGMVYPEPNPERTHSCCGKATKPFIEVFAPANIDGDDGPWVGGAPSEANPGYIPFVVTTLLWAPEDVEAWGDQDFATLLAMTDGTDDSETPGPAVSTYGPLTKFNPYEAMGNPGADASQQGVATAATLMPTYIYLEDDWELTPYPSTPWSTFSVL